MHPVELGYDWDSFKVMPETHALFARAKIFFTLLIILFWY